EPPTEVTRLLRELRSGSPDVESRLFELIYRELRRMAGARMQSERPAHTLSPTALVHEVYLRMSGTDETYENRAHFLAVAARAMRHILVDHARARRAEKRGALADAVALEGLDVPAPQTDEELLLLDDALGRLAAMSPRQSQVVEMRYFAGLTEEEVATVLGVTRRTVNRDWSMARAWLYGQLKPGY
ncbi:MAG: ECF-type sigma factor, partial [Bryobacteraceae bacterium]